MFDSSSVATCATSLAALTVSKVGRNPQCASHWLTVVRMDKTVAAQISPMMDVTFERIVRCKRTFRKESAAPWGLVNEPHVTARLSSVLMVEPAQGRDLKCPGCAAGLNV